MSFMGRFGAVVKNMAQMAAAFGAKQFDPFYSERAINFLLDDFQIHGLCKTWPAGTRFEFIKR